MSHSGLRDNDVQVEVAFKEHQRHNGMVGFILNNTLTLFLREVLPSAWVYAAC